MTHLTAAILLADFPPVSKAQWLQQVASDLKGRSPDELTWRAPGGLSVPPFAHRDDFQTMPVPLVSDQSGWEICEDIEANLDAGAAGKQVREALEGGAEGLCFCLDKTPDSIYFSGITEGIYLDYVGLHFAGAGVAENPGTLLALLDQAARKHHVTTAALRGSLHWNPAHSETTKKIAPDWRYAADLVQFAAEQFPHFRVFTIENKTVQEGPVAALVSLLEQCNDMMLQLTKRGIAPAEVARQMQIEVTVGKNYFLEITKIRALKILWFNLLKSWNIAPTWPVISARFDAGAYETAGHTNMIRATTMAMSAALGGASRLTVLPFDACHSGISIQSKSFARRIARNVQHLLKMESDMDSSGDPAAGSYYIEQLTHQMAIQAWSHFLTFSLSHPLTRSPHDPPQR